MLEISRLGGQMGQTHFTCTVLDIPAGTPPLLITVRLPTLDSPANHARWFGFPLIAVGDTVICRRDPNDQDVLIVEGSGEEGGGGGYPFNIITVDSTGTAEHTTLTAAISAASSGDTIRIGPGTYPENMTISKNLVITGIDRDATILAPTTGIVIDGVTVTFEMMKISGSAASAISAFKLINGAVVEFRRGIVNANNSGSGDSNAIEINNGILTLVDTFCSGSGGTTGRGVYAHTSSSNLVSIKRGGISGGTYDLEATAGEVVLEYPILQNGTMNASGVTLRGSATDYKGRDAGTIVVNSSGITISRGSIGYLDEAGEFKTTTTAQDSKMVGNGCVVAVGGADGNYVFVQNRKTTVVKYTGSAPAAGDYLTSSTTAGSAQAQTTMHPNIFAVCTAAGSAGQVEVQLLINRTVIGLSSTNDVIRVDSHSGTVFTGTIVQFTGGDSKLIEYNISTGNEASIKPALASHLGKFVLHNTTRGNTALIDSVNTTDTATPAAGTITTLSTPVGWAASDVIEVNSQTNTQTHGSVKFFEVDLSSADNTVIPALATAIIIEVTVIDTGGANIDVVVHPFEAYSDAKTKFVTQPVANIAAPAQKTIPLINQRFTIACEASGSGTAVFLARITGAWIASP